MDTLRLSLLEVDFSWVKLFSDLGIPSACVALVFLAMKFGPEERWFKRTALGLVLVFLTIFFYHQWDQLRHPPNLEPEVTPTRWHAFTPEGRPVDVTIRVPGPPEYKRTYPSGEIFREGLRLTRDPESRGYQVRFGREVLGPLDPSSANALCPEPDEPSGGDTPEYDRVWNISRAFLNQSPVPLGSSEFGELELQLHSYNDDGSATVSLLADGDPVFSPDTVRLGNKAVENLSLRGGDEFLLAIREADFRRARDSWAGFIVIGP